MSDQRISPTRKSGRCQNDKGGPENQAGRSIVPTDLEAWHGEAGLRKKAICGRYLR